jgi:hypothetical protein
MILTVKQQEEFGKAAEPLMKFLNDNFNPHIVVIVNLTRAELFEGISSFMTDAFIKD